MSSENQHDGLVGSLGIAGVLLFGVALLIFGHLNPGFDFFSDFISKLGARNEPNAAAWNVIGFASVGALLLAFGIGYGKSLKDWATGLFLSCFGLGFALTAIPMEMERPDSPVSKAHVVAICLGLACWMFGLARISSKHQLHPRIRFRANITAVLVVTAMIGYGVDVWSMAMTHRLVFLVVFLWTGITAIEMVVSRNEENGIRG